MKTTIDLPDPLFRKVKATAEGVSLKSFITKGVGASAEHRLQAVGGNYTEGLLV
ncbi:MAG: hypothetical protein N2A42_10575 [Luteolibacter sp.]